MSGTLAVVRDREAGVPVMVAPKVIRKAREAVAAGLVEGFLPGRPTPRRWKRISTIRRGVLRIGVVPKLT